MGVSILPTCFPKECFDQAIALQNAFNRLYMTVATDSAWLRSVFGPLLKHDSFLAALWDIHDRVTAAGVVQDMVCGLFRSDYMAHKTEENVAAVLKQVEMNTFSCAGSCHAERVMKLQHRLAQLQTSNDSNRTRAELPENQNTRSIVQALKAAHDAYKPTTDRKICVLITVQPFNFNIADERPIQEGLLNAGINCYRCEWQTILANTELTSDRTLLFKAPFSMETQEVSIVYYRGGYSAAEYRQQSWKTRLQLEMSRAIKCPDLMTHLATFKVVQAALAQPGVLERYLPAKQDEHTIQDIRDAFMPLQILDNSPKGTTARSLATNPTLAKHYILKPNLEGGGNNIYAERIPAYLAQSPEEQWSQYTLMRLIEPLRVTGTLMPPGSIYHGEVVSELGVLGTCLWRRPGRENGGRIEILRNETAGWTFKTKPADVQEMNVVKGTGCFDCPRLI